MVRTLLLTYKTISTHEIIRDSTRICHTTSQCPQLFTLKLARQEK